MAGDSINMTSSVGGASTAAPRLGGLSARISVMYAAIYLHYGAFGLFIPMWFEHRGLTPEQIGTLMSLPMFLRILFVAPVSGLADRLQRIREVLLVCVVGAMLIMSFMSFAQTYWQMLIFFTVFALVWDPLPILADAYAVLSVRSRGLDFGRMRLWGSLAFVAANIASGSLIGLYSPEVIPWFTAALLAVPIVPILLLPPDRTLGSQEKAERVSWRNAFSDRSVVVAMIGAAFIATSHVLLNTFGTIQFTAMGLDGTTIGALVGVSILAEILVLFAAQKVLGARSPLWLIAIGGLTAVARWIFMSFQPGLYELVVLQFLNGITGMGVIAGLMLFIAQRVDGRLIATVQGINAVVLGLTSALATFASGYVWKALGYNAYLIAAFVAALGCAPILLALRKKRA